MRVPAPTAVKGSSGKVTIPAPTGGWNARDPIANMPKTDAIFLDNLFPRASDVTLRKGSQLFASLTYTQNYTFWSFLTYARADGTSTLFVASSFGLHEVGTNGGAIGEPVTTALGTRWAGVNISTAGGKFLWCCIEGSGNSRVYNGTTWTELNAGSTPALTGVVSANIVNVSLFKSRLIFTVKDSLSFWFLPPNSIAGIASEFPLGALFRRGGYIVATETWTLDGGAGPEDYFVAITSEGEVAVYAGIDPGDAAAWGLVGIYYISKPLTRDCFFKFGGELIVATQQGLFPLSKVLQTAALNPSVALSDKISQAWTDYTSAYGSLYGWQFLLYPEASMLIVNVPVTHPTVPGEPYSYQFVMNTQTGAWTRFVGMPARAITVYNGKFLFARDDRIYQGLVGTDDLGAEIVAAAKTAFLYLQKRGLAHLKLFRPIVTSDVAFTAQFAVDADYEDISESAYSVAAYVQRLHQWDVDLWDAALWAAASALTGQKTQARWLTAGNKPGSTIALRLRMSVKDVNMSWIATDFLLQSGGIL